VEEIEFDHSHISGGLSKIMTADNVIGIFTSRAMKERGRYQIQFMKTRSSSGVGQKVDLEFNLDTLRITDLGEDQDSNNSPSAVNTQNVLNSIKRTSVVTTASTADILNRRSSKETANTNEAPKIRGMLAALNPERD